MTQFNNDTARGSKLNPTNAIAASVEGVSYGPPIYDTPQGALAPEPEAYIVQNIFPGPQYISDIRLSFNPYEVIDLTWEDPRYVKRSTDLNRALRAGYLRRLSKLEWQEILENEALAKRAATENAMHNQAATQQNQFNVNGKVINADVLDMDGNAKGHHGEEITTAGNWNDPQTYAIEENKARAAATSRGQKFDAAEFGKWVQAEVKVGRNGPLDSNKVRNPMGGPQMPGSDMALMFPNGTTSGATERGKYTTSRAPSYKGDQDTVEQGYMTNFNQQQQIAGSSASGIGVIPNEVAQPALAEHIDLNSDDAYGYDGEDSGGIKKLF